MVFHSAGASIIEHAKERKSGSHWTLSWRKPDSNHRSLSEENDFQGLDPGQG
jgi:hypothetical protein